MERTRTTARHCELLDKATKNERSPQLSSVPSATLAFAILPTPLPSELSNAIALYLFQLRQRNGSNLVEVTVRKASDAAPIYSILTDSDAELALRNTDGLAPQACTLPEHANVRPGSRGFTNASSENLQSHPWPTP